MEKNKLSFNFDSVLIYLIGLNLSTVLIVPNRLKAFPIIMLFVLSVFKFYNSKQKKSVKLDLLIAIALPFILFLISLTYSDDIKMGLKRLSTMIPIVSFPIIFLILKKSDFKISNQNIKNILLTFAAINVLFFVITFVYFWNQEFNFNETIVHYSNLINIRLGKFSQHPIYFSIYTSVAIISSYYYLLKSNFLKEKITLTMLIFVLMIIMGILMRKGPLIYLFIILGFISIAKINFKKGLLITLLLILFTGMVIEYFPKYKNLNRFEELITYSDNENPNGSTQIRSKIYKCCLEKIIESPVIGYGVGATQKKLDPCYSSNNIDLSLKTYNSHNQYFSIALTGGLISLLIFIIFTFKIFKALHSKRSILGISMFVLLLLNFLTENVLERENGAILYGLLMSIFVFYNYEKSS